MALTTSHALLEAAQRLRRDLALSSFAAPVTHVYNPLEYAWAPYAKYVERFASGPREVIFLGMNPGPFGMAQCGIPFGEINLVRDWMGINEPVGKPTREHPKRLIEGFACRRSEVSGKRLWGWARATFGEAESFFARHFVVNYCPLIFLEETGRNRTPDKLPAVEMAPVSEACDAHLASVIAILRPRWLVGVGGFAEARLRAVAGDDGAQIVRIPHPSPANPAANRDWAGATTKILREVGCL
jgi:single-strand selective monofunctional uracil DNA glycosylase